MFTESASFNPLVTSSFRDFRSNYPDVEISLEEHPSTELVGALRAGRLDAAFVRPPLREEPGIAFELLETEELVVAVPSGHELARRESLELRELATQTFILYPRAVRPGLADAIVTACEAAGFTPRVEQYAPQLSSTVNLVAAALGISIVPRSMQSLQPDLVAYIGLSGQPLNAMLGIAYRANENSAPVVNFISAARSGPTPRLTPPDKKRPPEWDISGGPKHRRCGSNNSIDDLNASCHHPQVPAVPQGTAGTVVAT